MRVTSTHQNSFRAMLPRFIKAIPSSLRDRSRSDQGLSLIECLVAIVVITITVVAITPPIMLATASRVQSRKAEKANQIAQGEVDRVRVLVERGGGSYTLSNLPSSSGTDISAVNVGDPPAANGPLLSPAGCGTYPSSTQVGATELIRVDVDGDCTPEYVMQVFRTVGQTPTSSTKATDPPFSFVMGVRVYNYYGPSRPFLPLDKVKSSLRMGTAEFDVVNGRRRPTAVLYSTMTRNDSSKSLDCLQATSNCN